MTWLKSFLLINHSLCKYRIVRNKAAEKAKHHHHQHNQQQHSPSNSPDLGIGNSNNKYSINGILGIGTLGQGEKGELNSFKGELFSHHNVNEY
jgi:hypothetical protein